MARKRITILTLTALGIGTMTLSVGLSSCEQPDPPEIGDQPAGSDGWLRGSPQEKFETIAGQFGGFDQTMIEVGYRYQELYWAGMYENWDFARYHVDEMRDALEKGFERRPAREASADAFMNVALPELEEAIVAEDPDLFADRFADLKNQCNACHVMEEVPYIVVEEPQQRTRPWVPPPEE